MENIDNFDNWYPSWIQIVRVPESEERRRGGVWSSWLLLIDDISQVSTQAALAWSAEVGRLARAGLGSQEEEGWPRVDILSNADYKNMKRN